MSETVHILATVNNPRLMDAARLVFKTLRVGFPDAFVAVYGNGLNHLEAIELEAQCREIGRASYAHGRRRGHDAWIEDLVMSQSEPFWICDTDIVFFGRVQGRQPEGASLAGRFEPEFMEEWTQSFHVERLHTCLMWIDPMRLRMLMREWSGRLPGLFRTSWTNLIRQQFIPSRRGMLFYDTMAGAWQAGFGAMFDEALDSQFEHLHCATYVEHIAPHLSVNNLTEAHQEIYKDPQKARGLRIQQAKYYAQRRPTSVGATGQTLVIGENTAHVER